MTITEKQQKQQKELHSKLWEMANSLRGNMEAYEFKNYILGIIFYRFLSEKTQKFMKELLKNDNMTYEEAWELVEYKEALVEESLQTLGYVIEPEYLFSNLIKQIDESNFSIEMLNNAIKSVESSALGAESEDAFDGLFEDIDLESTKLGREVKSRSDLMSKILTTVESISFEHDDLTIDVLGDAYMYLIGKFAQTSGKKGGEFMTPASISELVARIATQGQKDIKSVYDPTCGTGGLLIETTKYADVRTFYGQEMTSTTYNLARMNMIIHNVPFTNFSIFNGDTLENPAFLGEKFQIQVANPPYSTKWSMDNRFLTDDRFSQYGRLAPKGKADFAFVQHMIYHMEDDGVAVILLPNGVLFRGGAEKVIREYIIKELDVLDAVIGLPGGCFMGTPIEVTCLVLKKNRKNKDILFVDASQDVIKGKPVNSISPEAIDTILKTIEERKDVEKYASVVTKEQLEKEKYNCSIQRFVDTREDEIIIDIDEVSNKIKEIDNQIAEIDKELEGYFQELGILGVE